MTRGLECSENVDDTLKKDDVRKYDFIEQYKNIPVWSKIAAFSTAIEWLYVKTPLVAAPAIIFDVGGSVGNVLAKIKSNSVSVSDGTGLVSSFLSFIGGMSSLASIGIETSSIGFRLINL